MASLGRIRNWLEVASPPQLANRLCNMLYEPDVRRERYRADSVSHHPELKFFPNHEHSAPNRNRDKVNPSFLYGIPLLDVKRLREVGKKFGAYPQSGINVTA